MSETELVQGLTALGLGKFSGLVGLLVLAIRVLRTDLVQTRLPSWAQWSSWPNEVKVALPFVASIAAGVVTYAAGGMTLGVAISTAILAAVFGSSLHEATAAAGARLTPVTVKLPTMVRGSMAIVLPIAKELQAPVIK